MTFAIEASYRMAVCNVYICLCFDCSNVIHVGVKSISVYKFARHGTGYGGCLEQFRFHEFRLIKWLIGYQ